MKENITALCQEAIKRSVFPGCVVGVVADGLQWRGAFGKYTYASDAPPVREDSIYDVASITKAVPVALLALQLIDQGKLHYDDRLTATVPFTGTWSEDITLLHLLTHTLDFGFRLSAFRELEGNALLEKILSAPLRSPPGTVFSYANATSILLGMVVERITGKPLDAAADELLFGPLGMSRTGFFPERGNADDVVPTEFDPGRGRLVHAEVHDESAFALRPKVVGSAGLFSTVPDLLKVMRMLVDEGVYGGSRFFSTGTVALMHTNLSPAPGSCAGAGWELAQPAFMGSGRGGQTFGKTGFTGCSMVIDPVARAGVILLSNHVHPKRHPDRSIINEVRSGLADCVFSAIKASHSNG
ncbi:MAG: beta-lactamase family protein [Chitinispirillaceae bacterium]|nr:beta-lactamase family protein [Chitinispirillaceae bacterium]